MSNEKSTDSVNWKSLREKANLTLGELSELTGYSVATINGLELHGEGSKRLKDKLASALLERVEEGEAAGVKHWRDRALRAEKTLDDLKNAMKAWLNKI